MDKNSAYELQKIDCNCNDCGYLVRDLEKYKVQIAHDKSEQIWFFRRKKARRLWEARKKFKKDPIKGAQSLKEAIALSHTYRPQIVQSNYGNCSRFEKDINFLPNTFQIDTQDCFKHRKDLKNEAVLS